MDATSGRDGWPFRRDEYRGRTFVYVFPCRDEDVLKIGFSRDPLQRLLALHTRFFAFFDLDRGLLIETDRIGEARALERELFARLVECRVRSPLDVSRSAAGHTEWFRGASPQVEDFALALGHQRGFAIHCPLTDWVRGRLQELDGLFDWSSRMVEVIDDAARNPGLDREARRLSLALENVLDAHEAVGLALDDRVSGTVLRWYRARQALRFA